MGGHPVVREDYASVAALDLPWERFAGATVWVSGASGMIGGYIAEFLLYLNDNVLETPCHVAALVRDEQRAGARFAGYGSREDLIIGGFYGGSLAFGLPQPDYVIHGAAQSGASFYRADPVGTLRPNVQGTGTLLEAARKAPDFKGFLFLSSGVVYGELQNRPDEVGEGTLGPVDPMNPLNCYAFGKLMGEHLCAVYGAQYGVRAIPARLGHTYGPGMNLNDERVFADFVRCVLEKRDITLKTSGSAVREFCYLSDALSALMLLLLKGEAGRAYNVVNNGAATTIAGLAETLCAAWPELGLKVVRGGGGERGDTVQERGLILSSARLSALGWQPEIGIAEGFRRTVRSFST